MHCVQCGRRTLLKSALRQLYTAVRNRSKTHYDVLGIKTDASLPEIKNAFYTLCKKVSFIFRRSLFCSSERNLLKEMSGSGENVWKRLVHYIGVLNENFL